MAIDRTDTEKKIAEIRKSAEEARKTDRSWVDGQDYADDVEFLLDELGRLEREYAEERAAHNAHVTELCELEKKYAAFLEQWEVYQTQLQSAQQEIERLREERDKLIEGLRWYADAVNYEYRTSYLDQDAPIIDDSGQRARAILKEIGVTVE